jgi:hypothetical protein
MNTKGVNLVDSFISTGESMSSLLAVKGNGAGSPTEEICYTIQVAGPCSFTSDSGWFLSGTILLGKCQTAGQINCIESLSVGTSESTMKEANFLRMTEGPSTPSNDTIGLTEGSSTSLWQSDVNHMGGKSTYSAFVALKVSYNEATKSVWYSGLTAAINPYTEISNGKYRAPSLRTFTKPDGNPAVSRSGGELECAWTSTSLCGLTEEFAPDTRAGFKLRISNNITGWFSGRLSKPSVQITPIDAKANLLSITGSSVKVTRLSAFVNKSVPLPYFDEDMIGSGWFGGTVNSRTDSLSNAGYLEDFRSIVKDTASGVNDVWNINTVPGVSSHCFTDSSKVHGIVTTNSLIYSGESPTFSNQTIKYNVAGMHYMPDGVTPVEGTYDLVMRSETARCLYRFSDSPIAASISVTNSNGELKTAVTNFSEKNGWVHFSAYGFGFSEPQISVKLTQPKPAKKITITCVNTKKPKLTKKITAVAPKCPAGYKTK